MSCDDSVETMQHRRQICIKAPVVVGLGETEVLERVVLDIPTLAAALDCFVAGGTADRVLREVVVLTKKVTITDCEVFTDKVLLNGVLHKDLLLKFFPVEAFPLEGVVRGATNCVVTPAAVGDIAIDCPFGACIPVRGACVGDRCEVDLACVDAEKDLLIDINGDGIPDLFEEKVCIRIAVKAVREEQITITPNEMNLCPQLTPSTSCGSPSTGCLNTSPLQTSVTVSRPGAIVG